MPSLYIYLSLYQLKIVSSLTGKGIIGKPLYMQCVVLKYNIPHSVYTHKLCGSSFDIEVDLASFNALYHRIR